MTRLLAVPVLMLAMVGCGANWKTIPTDPVCTPYPWFLDADGDGWGDPGTTGVVQCQPDDTTGYTVQNNRDCDDSDATITGRAGSLCPADIVVGNGTITQFASGTTEYLIVNVAASDPKDGSSVVWPEYARDVCGPEGWGGTYVIENEDGTIQEDVIDTSRDPAGLWTPGSDADVSAVKAQIEGADFYATWINGVVDTSGDWVWGVSDPSTKASFSSLGNFCDNVTEPPGDVAVQQLAYIKRVLASGTTEFCLGSPELAFGRYFKDVTTAVDLDGDGLADNQEGDLGADTGDKDSDDDGIGDGQEVDVMGTAPDDDGDEFPLLNPGDADPTVAFQTELAYFVCERDAPNPARFAMHDLPAIP